MYLLGFDIGSSSVKACLIDGESGECRASAFYPKKEMPIQAVRAGWAEQDPEQWWENLKLAVAQVMSESAISPSDIDSIGISYQMHGLVLVDKDKHLLRPSIIWCDSRAAATGDKAFREMGKERCLNTLLNSPGNFTAAKLKWVKDNEPGIYNKTFKFMLPGDYIAMRLSGDITTTPGGLSEGIFWDFRENRISHELVNHFGFRESLIPDVVPSFSVQGEVCGAAAGELGLVKGIKICYRAGDQPNNALSLNVLNPGEIAATAGTSGVVYGVSAEIRHDPLSRVNTFAHVNHSHDDTRLGVLLCINGTGILNSWIRKISGGRYSYDEMNKMAEKIGRGSEGVTVFPFGNGAERALENKEPGGAITGLNFNIHNEGHLFRATQEGIVFSFRYGIDIMKDMGINARVIRAGKANMFLSPVFREALASVSGAAIELYNTDGAMGAARGAGIGSGYYRSAIEAFAGLTKLDTTEPDPGNIDEYEAIYQNWKHQLIKTI